MYNLANHITFNSGEFINCDIDKVTISVNCQYTDNTETIVFKNCVLPIYGCLIKLSPFAYSKGITNVIFDNCIITDYGKCTITGYNMDTSLINAISQPREGSSITFRNCTINKPTGLLLQGYKGGDCKLDLIFENTPLSENLQIQDEYKNFVNLIIK